MINGLQKFKDYSANLLSEFEFINTAEFLKESKTSCLINDGITSNRNQMTIRALFKVLSRNQYQSNYSDQSQQEQTA